MKLRWKTLFVQVTLWAVSEVALNCAGIDDLADYSEYILDRKQALIEAVSAPNAFATLPASLFHCSNFPNLVH